MYCSGGKFSSPPGKRACVAELFPAAFISVGPASSRLRGLRQVTRTEATWVSQSAPNYKRRAPVGTRITTVNLFKQKENVSDARQAKTVDRGEKKKNVIMIFFFFKRVWLPEPKNKSSWVQNFFIHFHCYYITLTISLSTCNFFLHTWVLDKQTCEHL